jgi:hypothetical protein
LTNAFLLDKAPDGVFCPYGTRTCATAAGFARSFQLSSSRPGQAVQSAREGGMDRPSQHKSHPAGSLSVTNCNENPVYVFPGKELRSLSPNSYIQVSASDSYISRIGPHIWLQLNRQSDPGNIYINLSKIYEFRNWETEHYNYVLEIRMLHSFLGIHTWEPDIYSYIRFSPALHLQCDMSKYNV